MAGTELVLLEFIQDNLRSGFMDLFMVFVTDMGNLGAIWLVVAAALLLRGEERKTGIAIAAALVLAFVAGGIVIKPLVARIRPCDIDTTVRLLIDRPRDFSFPSGHASSSFAAVTVLFLAGSTWRRPAAVLAALIAFSRLYLFVHYPSDVIAGILLGMLCGWLCAERWCQGPSLWEAAAPQPLPLHYTFPLTPPSSSPPSPPGRRPWPSRPAPGSAARDLRAAASRPPAPRRRGTSCRTTRR